MTQQLPSPPTPTNVATLRLPAEPESAATARRFARRWLSASLPDGDGDGHTLADDVLLVLTELVANAVQHTPSTHVLCRLALTGDEIRLAVADQGGTLAVPALRLPADDAECGRGLLLVEALASSWSVVPLEPDGRAVCAELKIPG